MSLCHFVTISLGRVGVKGIMDNVTKYDVFFLAGIPKQEKRTADRKNVLVKAERTNEQG